MRQEGVAAYKSRRSALYEFVWEKGFGSTSPSEEQPNKSLNNKDAVQIVLVRCAHIP